MLFNIPVALLVAVSSFVSVVALPTPIQRYARTGDGMSHRSIRRVVLKTSCVAPASPVRRRASGDGRLFATAISCVEG